MKDGATLLREWMKRAHLNGRDTAWLLQIDYTHLSHILHGRKFPSLTVADRIYEVTGVPIASWVPKRKSCEAA
jgi:transcriptional regulator with XRE-family HTH domain